MHITGIIAEYDPFHNGHKYHLDAAKAAGADKIVVVLGGNFTQRGEPALLSKTVRAKAALAGGADLVVELPLPWACASAESFARGGIALLHHAGCVDTVCFGSECGDVDRLTALARLMQTPDFAKRLQTNMQVGVPYAKAVQQTVETLTDASTAALLTAPNNTLGLEYCKALLSLRSPMRPLTVLRESSVHNGIASAGHIRALVQSGDTDLAAKLMPLSAFTLLKQAVDNGQALTDTALADRVILAFLRRLSKQDFASLPAVSEGLENRLYTAVRQQPSLQGVIDAVQTKRYTAARIRRILTAAYVGIPAQWETKTPPYLRVLGIGENGKEVLSLMQKHAAVPLFADPMQPPADCFSKAIFDLECHADDLYGGLLPTPTPCGQIFTTGMLKHE